MEHCTTTDVRDLDCVYLATIGGCDYYETRQIVGQAGGVRSVIGLASAWPLIQRDARIRELSALLTASEQRSVEADTHCVELLSRLSSYEEHITALEAALSEKWPPEIPSAEVRVAETAFVERVAAETAEQPRIEAPADVRRKCPHCTSRPLLSGMQAHIERDHPDHITVVAVRQPAPIELALGEKPWRCDQCHTDAHARSLKDPALCIRCVIASADQVATNGHLVAA